MALVCLCSCDFGQCSHLRLHQVWEFLLLHGLDQGFAISSVHRYRCVAMLDYVMSCHDTVFQVVANLTRLQPLHLEENQSQCPF